MGEQADAIAQWDMTDPLYEYNGPKTCRYCGRNDLEWFKHETGWRLFEMESGWPTLHECEEYRKSK